uniref:Zinc transporter ZIP14 n=1 Tax=Macrostomum lignano TaxID=282301 RepID=A0A1I8I4V7_9PLAT
MSALNRWSICTLVVLLLSSVAAASTESADTDENESSYFNDTVLLESVMALYGSTIRDRLYMNRAQVRDLINFGKNSTRNVFMRLMQRRLRLTPWGNKLKCETVDTLLNDTTLTDRGNGINGTEELSYLLPRLLFAMQNPNCYVQKSANGSNSDYTTWLYTLLAVLVMKVCALAGILTFPCMSATVYTMALSFLVPLAISSLMGSTLFIFMPEILNLPNIPHYDENFGDPIMKMLTVGGGIYLFYLIEKLLRMLMEHKEKKFYNSSVLNRSYSLNAAQDSVTVKPSRKISTTMAGDISSFPRQVIETMRDSRIELSMTDSATSVKPEDATQQQIAPIAWIAIMGDCIRNFIDGDVAILLSAGMTICRATMYHFFAAIFAFVGGALGILLGDLGQSQIWIFSVSAGAFLYIALVDLMPEMNHALESDKAKGIGRLKIFLLQNFGLILGFAVTSLLGIYKEALHFEFGDDAGH